MMIKDVIFPEALLNALQDGRLVVFAGAGVSMGPPAGLPSFRKLAEQVAEGTGESIAESETDDQFLGRLEDRKVQIHQRAADILQRSNLEPNTLHRSLLRLFKKTGPVRIVTTNFDCLFEQAAEAGDLFQTKPKVFEAPVLPLGSRFQGIVHLHGSVQEPEEMVLTHRDFGRAYLTEEDGWARRFLVSLFAEYTVLFVGYSHSDTIMTYLTPSLPPDGTERRFALVGRINSDSGRTSHDRWRRMGIQPISFHQENKSNFIHLDRAMEGLAEFSRCNLLDWQQKITEIARRDPPIIHEEDSCTIGYILTRADLLQFFVDAAQYPEWIAWLDRREHLIHLFRKDKLKDQDMILSKWLAGRFMRSHSSSLFSIISKYSGRLNRDFWGELLVKLSSLEENPLDQKTLSRWIHILMSCVPVNVNKYLLLKLMTQCNKVGALQSLLQVYNVMTANLAWFLPDSDLRRYDSYDDYDDQMKEIWIGCLKPNFPHIAHTLLEKTTMRLEQRHSARIAWNEDDNTTDYDSSRRSAIEPHEQDQRPYKIDPLIDVARECLEWLVIHDLITARMWCDRFSSADAPLLRRLAIHATDARTDLSADGKVAWLLERCDVNETDAHHEIFRMTKNTYRRLSRQKREALIQAISSYQLTGNTFTNNDTRLADYRFNWFHWLLQADLSCELLKRELNTIKVQYPRFMPREHPDFTSYLTTGSIKSPWKVERLLARPAHEWLSNLLNYQSSWEEKILFNKSRHGLLLEISEAAKRDTVWSLDLADAMAEKSEWESDLWEWIIYAWEEADLDQGSTRRVLSHLSKSKLHHRRNARAITELLNKLIQKTNATDLTQWLDTLHKIAIAIHPHAVAVEDESREDPHQTMGASVDLIKRCPQDRDWFQEAINHPSGKLAEFWIHSIAHWRKQQVVLPQALNPEYQRALDAIIQDNGTSGKLGRTILVSDFNFLYNVDSVWAEQYLLPLFDAEHGDFSCAWDGFTFLRPLSPQLLELLQDKLIGALQRGIREFPQDTLERFVQSYVATLIWLIKDTNNHWISEFFKYAQENVEIKHKFAVQIRNQLRNLDESQQQECWNVWLKNYWKNRLQGVPCPLEDRETAEMFEWVIHLQGVFPEAVAMAVQMKPVTSGDYSNILHQISESNLIDHYPNELVQFLIHLGSTEHLPWFWETYLDVIHKLSQKDLPADLAQGVRELIVRLE